MSSAQLPLPPNRSHWLMSLSPMGSAKIPDTCAHRNRVTGANTTGLIPVASHRPTAQVQLTITSFNMPENSISTFFPVEDCRLSGIVPNDHEFCYRTTFQQRSQARDTDTNRLTQPRLTRSLTLPVPTWPKSMSSTVVRQRRFTIWSAATSFIRVCPRQM